LFEAKADITDTKSFIPRAHLSYAENALLGHANPRSTAKLAIIGAVEPSEHCPSGITRTLTFAQLYDEVNFVSNALKKLGIKPSDKWDAVHAESSWNTDNLPFIAGSLPTLPIPSKLS
jgi:acyl-coenzyme A synthetase/AMP-(fatty) acid ligase